MKLFLTMLPFWFSLTFADDPILDAQLTTRLEHVTLNLYQQLAKTSTENFLFSPLSLTDVMALVQSGANGPSEEEIRSAFKLGNDKSEVAQALSHFKKHLVEQNDYTVHSANKIYVADGVPLKQSFKKTAEEVFYSEVENVDFKANDVAANTINGWVEEKTEHKIKNLIDPADLDSDTTAILVNALHFKANWSQAFSHTVIGSFKYNHYATKMQVETLRGFVDGRSGASLELDAEFLELPFQGGEVTFTVALPFREDGIKDLEDRLGEVFSFPVTHETLADVSLPKFKIETKLNLNRALQEMGVKTIFTDSADLSGIAGEPGQIKVSKVEQKSYIDVDKGGVEAAAATSANAVAVNAEPYIEFRADHPFIFYIKFKGFVIFAGRIVDP